MATWLIISTVHALTTVLKDRVMEGWEKSRWSTHRAQKRNLWSYFGKTKRNIPKEDQEGRGQGLGRKKRGSAFQVGSTIEATVALKQQVRIIGVTWYSWEIAHETGKIGNWERVFGVRMLWILDAKFICIYLDALFWHQQKEHTIRTEGHRETENC